MSQGITKPICISCKFPADKHYKSGEMAGLLSCMCKKLNMGQADVFISMFWALIVMGRDNDTDTPRPPRPNIATVTRLNQSLKSIWIVGSLICENPKFPCFNSRLWNCFGASNHFLDAFSKLKLFLFFLTFCHMKILNVVIV